MEEYVSFVKSMLSDWPAVAEKVRFVYWFWMVDDVVCGVLGVMA